MAKLTQKSQRVCLVLISLFISAVIFEAFLRLLNYQYHPLRIEVLQQHDWRYYHAFKDKHFVYDPNLIWRPRRNVSVFNAQGFRGRELQLQKEPGSIRIFTIGDSNTLGWTEGGGHNWPMYLQALLAKIDDRIVVVNAGVPGYSSFQGLRRFQEILSFQPDAVLVSFGWNDTPTVPISDAEFDDRKMRKLRLDVLLSKCRIGQLVLALSDKVTSKRGNQLVPRVSWQEYKDNLSEMIRLSKERNIKVVLLTRPFINATLFPFWQDVQRYNAATLEVARENHVPVVDLYSRFEGKKEYFVDECHFNEAGHRLAAGLIFQHLKKVVKRLPRV